MAKIPKNLFWVIIMLAMIYLSSCEKYSYEVKPPEISADTVFFKAEIQPIFDTKCVSCHKASLSPDLRPDKSYKAIIDGGYVNVDLPAEESKLFKILDVPSHTSFTTLDERNKILSWIFQGTMDN